MPAMPRRNLLASRAFWPSIGALALLAACSGSGPTAGPSDAGYGGMGAADGGSTGGSSGTGGASSGGAGGTSAAGGTGGVAGAGGGAGATSQAFVSPSGTSFVQNGQDYSFVGANLRGITDYGHGDALPYADAGQIELSLSAVQGMNGKVIRAFTAYKGIDAQTTGDRLGAVLDAAESHGITVIVVLTDFYATDFHPQGDDGFYANDLNGYTVLDHDFFASGYQQNYKPEVQALVSRFKDHPAIFSWELGNEIRDATFSNSSADTFIAFCKDMASSIHAVDSNHMISVGEISALGGMSQAQAQQLYGDPDISFLTIRSYDGGTTDDTGLAQSLGKPIIVEEAGYQSGDRPTELGADLSKWFGRGVRGYLQWGYVAATSDNGDGDKMYGMDRIFHADWDGLYATYKGFGQKL